MFTPTSSDASKTVLSGGNTAVFFERAKVQIADVAVALAPPREVFGGGVFPAKISVLMFSSGTSNSRSVRFTAHWWWSANMHAPRSDRWHAFSKHLFGNVASQVRTLRIVRFLIQKNRDV